MHYSVNRGHGGQRPSAPQKHRAQRPGEALIVGGFAPRDGRHGPYANGAHGSRSSRRRSTARVAAPLAVPVALGVTLGVILAVSSGPTHAHVTQQGTTSSSTPAATPSAAGSP